MIKVPLYTNPLFSLSIFTKRSEGNMMAFYEETVKYVEESLKCIICFEMFDEPVTLPCGHSYCHRCIKDHFKKNKRQCPQCREQVKSVFPLNKNVTLGEILDLLKRLEEWEPVRNDPETFNTGHGAALTQDDSFTNGMSSGESASSSLDSEGRSQSTDNSFSSLSGPDDSMNGSFQTDENDSMMSDAEVNTERMSGAPAEDGGLILDVSAASSVAESGRSGPEVPDAIFCRLSFPPHLGNRRLVFWPERKKMVVRSSSSSRVYSNRFEACQWMAEQEFSGGRHYWDVEVSLCSSWAAGVAYPDLRREQQMGRSATSWCLEWSSRRLSAWHDDTATPLPQGCLSRVRVLLDMDEGSLSFRSLPDGEEVYSVRVQFSGAVRPVFWLYGLQQNNALTFPLPNF